MSGIRALDSLSGKISGESVLKGTLSGIESLNGSICVTREYDTYSGDYKVVPKASGSQILNTANKVLKEDILVTEVPYWETSNESNGTTAYIAKEVDANGISYDCLKARLDIPCCKDVYYDLYRRFFWLLNKERG